MEYQKNLQYYNNKQEEYYLQLRRYQEQTEAENARIESKSAKVNTYNEALAKQRHQVWIQKTNAENALKELYSADIVYETYRGLLPISRFCHYIDSGLRDHLSGADGMYDLYEQELRSQMITNSMGRILQEVEELKQGVYALVREVDQIRSNQYKLIDEIDKSNRFVAMVSDQMQEVAYQTAMSLEGLSRQNEKIMESVAWTAYNTACTEHSTRGLADLEQMNYVHHLY